MILHSLYTTMESRDWWKAKTFEALDQKKVALETIAKKDSIIQEQASHINVLQEILEIDTIITRTIEMPSEPEYKSRLQQ
jgi:hypothetical protein